MQKLFVSSLKILALKPKILLAIPTLRASFSQTKQINEICNELLIGVGEPSAPIDEEPYTSKHKDEELKTLVKAINQNYKLGKYKKVGCVFEKLSLYVLQATDDSVLYIQESKVLYGANHPATLSGLNNLALILKTTGNFETAKTIYARILSSYIELFGSKQKSVIAVMQNLANLDTNEYDNALQLYNDVLALRKEVTPEDRVSLAVCLLSMAGAYRELKQYSKAEETLQESLQILKETVGEEHPQTAICYNNMGLTYKRQKKFEKAEGCYLKCLSIREKLFAKEHPDLIAIKHNIGELYVAMGKDDKAAEFLSDTLESIKTSEKANS